MTIPEVFDLLRYKQFTEAALDLNSKPGMIEDTLKKAVHEVRNTRSQTNSLEQFVLEVPGRFDHRKDYVSFHFDFYYYNDTEKLRMRAITAVMDESKKLYLFADPRQVVDSKKAYQDLVDIRAKKALEIYLNLSNRPVLQNSRHL